MKKTNFKKQLVKLFTVLAIAGTLTFTAFAQDGKTPDSKNAAALTARCSESTLRGSYGSNITGLFFLSPTASVPLASVGRFVFDGTGDLTGTDTNSFNGDISRYPFTGTYTVNRDCTGMLILTLPNGFVITSDIVIVDGGKEINLIQTNPGTVITGVLKRQ